MNGMIVFLALLFGGIAVWAVVNMLKSGKKSAPKPRAR